MVMSSILLSLESGIKTVETVLYYTICCREKNDNAVHYIGGGREFALIGAKKLTARIRQAARTAHSPSSRLLLRKRGINPGMFALAKCTTREWKAAAILPLSSSAWFVHLYRESSPL